MRTVYLDYNATTPLDASVREAMLPFLDGNFGNPSSVHHVGQRARVALDEARERVAVVLKCLPSEIIFTSGATESCNHALLGAARLLGKKKRHIVTSAIEHPAVLQTCEYLENKENFAVSRVLPDSSGRVCVEAVREAIRPDTLLVSLMAANNEVGTLQPVAEVGELCSHSGILFHTDAVQAFGKLPFSEIAQFRADLVTLCAHKFHGPKGAGVLYVRSPLQLPPLILGGSHENERRAGTENLPAIMGLALAVERFVPTPVFPADFLHSQTSALQAWLSSLDGVTSRGHSSDRLPNTSAFTVTGADSIALLGNLDLEGICASSGSACSSGSITPSHVLAAMGVPASEANSLIRLSLGRETSESHLEHLRSVLPGILERTRSRE